MASIGYNWENKTILIAEDIDFNYLFLASALKYTKANTLWAKNGKMAVELCLSNKVDLVLMDIQMPTMNGLEATKKIKETNPNLPVIAQTAFAMEYEKSKILESGIDDYLPKPISLEKLFQKIDQYLGEKR
jgi:two-component system, cell cycle response regulator DivK